MRIDSLFVPIMAMHVCLYSCLLWTFLLVSPTSTLHVEGIWNPHTDSLKILARFGVQKTQTHHDEDTKGYAYGNITISTNKEAHQSHNLSQCHNAFLLITNRTLFSIIRTLHSNPPSESTDSKNLFCQQVHDSLVGSKEANVFHKYVKHIPCLNSDKLDDELSNATRILNSQFTYVIDNQKEANFWYLLLVACRETPGNGTNQTLWSSSNISTPSIYEYDFWLVNGHPEEATGKIVDFDHQFSFEQQNLIFIVLLDIYYLGMFVFQCFSTSLHKSKKMGAFLTISLGLQCLSYSFICIHKFAFAHDGKGFDTLFNISELLKFVSMGLFIMFVLTIAKGWPMTKQEILSKTILYAICSIYTFIRLLLFIWIKNSLNMIDEIDEYQILPGWLNLLVRIGIMFWFLHELRHTMVLEQESIKLKFYLHFGAGILVWFVHLPLVVMVALQIDLMWRYKIITGFSSVADALAYCLVIKLLWDLKKINMMARDDDYDDDEEDFDESSLYTSETYKFSSANYRANHAYDNRSNCDMKA